MSHPIQTYREQQNLTRTALAAKLGVSEGMIRMIESGARRITPERAKAWAPILRISRARLCPEVFG